METTTKPALTPEQALLVRMKKLDIVDSAIRLAIPWGGACVILYLVYLSLASLAGKYTFASIAVSFLGNITVSKAVAYVFGLGGTGYGLLQRDLRRRDVERLSKRPKQLEQQIDANRSSSNLTSRGTTRPEDRR